MSDTQPHELPAMLSDPSDPPPAPPGLTHRGASLWTAVTARYEQEWDALDLAGADAVIERARAEPIEAGRERLLTGTCGLIDDVQLVLLGLGLEA